MPPTRSIPPAKAVKTERTHEENQERAYIAASRRSDRSLEARVESARRASEIHKRRTGRSLRVTEQDVINEEMYEEEDDDLPLQYRRLTAHLQTGSADFNRRLAAYLTNQVAMRSAMEQMLNNQYPPQYSQFSQNQPGVFQSSVPPQHNMSHSPVQSYRQAPYPSPHHPNFRNLHSRAYSMAALPNQGNHLSSPPDPRQSMDHRRMSTPGSGRPTPSIKTENAEADGEYLRETQSATVPGGHFPPFLHDIGPFTTSLPPESQQMIGPAMDANDPFQASLMHGSENFTSSPYYPFHDGSHGVKGMPVHPASYSGMSATLAPSALTATTGASTSATPVTSAPATTSEVTVPSAGLDFSYSQDSKHLYFQMDGANHNLDPGQVTPGEGFWGEFTNDGQWSAEHVSS